MKTNSFFGILFSAWLLVSSCSITGQVKTLQIEVLRPGIFNIPKDITVSVVKRDLSESDSTTFRYNDGTMKLSNYTSDPNDKSSISSVDIQEIIYQTKKDTAIKYSVLSDTCLYAMGEHLKSTGHFRSVIQPGDSLRQLLQSNNIENQEQLFELLNSDMAIFLDLFQLKTRFSAKPPAEFNTKAQLVWTFAFRTDSLAYTYKQADTLSYDYAQVHAINRAKDHGLNEMVTNTAIYLGQSFGKILVPSWIQVERIYYRSNNPEMRKAEQFAVNQDWRGAAEVWNKLSKSKNDKIAAKACFNMALACEMEGKPNLSIGWLVQSYSSLKRPDEYHQLNCQQYVNTMALRAKELERLKEQLNFK
jgi:hypothetical protein